ncbi:putative nucleotidyltransferase, ribonuclease H [Tanacetum coccineum]
MKVDAQPVVNTRTLLDRCWPLQAAVDAHAPQIRERLAKNTAAGASGWPKEEVKMTEVLTLTWAAFKECSFFSFSLEPTIEQFEEGMEAAGTCREQSVEVLMSARNLEIPSWTGMSMIVSNVQQEVKSFEINKFYSLFVSKFMSHDLYLESGTGFKCGQAGNSSAGSKKNFGLVRLGLADKMPRPHQAPVLHILRFRLANTSSYKEIDGSEVLFAREVSAWGARVLVCQEEDWCMRLCIDTVCMGMKEHKELLKSLSIVWFLAILTLPSGTRWIPDPKITVMLLRGSWVFTHAHGKIKAAQKDDGEIWAIIQNIDQQTEFRIDDDGILWQGTKLCVPEDPTLREALMTEAHSSPFSIHPGSTKMYHDLKQHFWWSGMKRDVATFVSKCLTCQQVKIEHQRASGLLQPLEIPVWKWDEISMDFVTGLPRTQRKHDAIWVVVDRLTKSAHFLPIRKDYPVSKIAEMFQQEIVRLHGTPSAIVSDRDPRFTSRFWKGLQKAWGTRLKFSTAFHPETDGQSERTIQTLEDMLRSCALEWAGNWDDYICLVEFAYNNSWHASIKCAPFEMLYGRKCRAPICWDQVGERILEGPEMIEVTNEKVAVAREKLKEAQTRQKSYADRHRRALEFQPGEHVFLKVSPTRGVRRFGIKGKLSPRFIGPFEILDRVGEVSYRLALPPQLSHVHNVFHVSLLRGYKYHPLHVVSYPFDQIREDLSYTEEPESILDRQDRVMRNKTIPFVKILWRNHPEREATWETEESIRTSYPHFLP